jgi:glutathione S-transferase
VRKYAQRTITRRIQFTSLGNLCEEEVRAEALKDIRALAAQLNSSNFIASNRLTIYDFSVAAHIASILYWRIDNWLTSLFKEHDIFDQYLQRVAEAVGGFDYEVQ